MKVHLYDYDGDKRVPDYDENKRNGYKIACCGYQRKNVTTKLDEVTCELCKKNCKTCGELKPRRRQDGI